MPFLLSKLSTFRPLLPIVVTSAASYVDNRVRETIAKPTDGYALSVARPPLFTVLPVQTCEEHDKLRKRLSIVCEPFVRKRRWCVGAHRTLIGFPPTCLVLLCDLLTPHQLYLSVSRSLQLLDFLFIATPLISSSLPPEALRPM